MVIYQGVGSSSYGDISRLSELVLPVDNSYQVGCFLFTMNHNSDLLALHFGGFASVDGEVGFNHIQNWSLPCIQMTKVPKVMVMEP
jgi:hypothetical protein